MKGENRYEREFNSCALEKYFFLSSSRQRTNRKNLKKILHLSFYVISYVLPSNQVYSVFWTHAKLPCILVINKNWATATPLHLTEASLQGLFSVRLHSKVELYFKVEDNENASFMRFNSLEAMNHVWSQICLLSALYLNNDIRNNFLRNQL